MVRWRHRRHSVSLQNLQQAQVYFRQCPTPPWDPAPSLAAPVPLPPPVRAPARLPANERLVVWPGVRRWKLSELWPTIGGVQQHTGYGIRCLSHSNSFDLPTLSCGMPECKISLTFAAKRDSFRMSPEECRLRVKTWVAGNNIDRNWVHRKGKWNNSQAVAIAIVIFFVDSLIGFVGQPVHRHQRR